MHKVYFSRAESQLREGINMYNKSRETLVEAFDTIVKSCLATCRTDKSIYDMKARVNIVFDDYAKGCSDYNFNNLDIESLISMTNDLVVMKKKLEREYK